MISIAKLHLRELIAGISNFKGYKFIGTKCCQLWSFKLQYGLNQKYH